MTDLSSMKARLPRLPLRTIIAVTLLLKGVRLLLWSSNAGHHSAAVLRGVAGRVIAFAERLAGVPDCRHDGGANKMLEGSVPLPERGASARQT
jgi:hypothetical protein